MFTRKQTLTLRHLVRQSTQFLGRGLSGVAWLGRAMVTVTTHRIPATRRIFAHLPTTRFSSLFHSTRRIAALAAVVLLVMVVPLIIWQFASPDDTQAAWFDGSYGYRKRIPVTNTSGSVQTDFQTELSLDTATQITAGKLQSDCDDLRFTDVSGKVLSYWLEPNTCNTATTKVFVKVPSIPTSGADIYWYYGNPSAGNASQIDQTFVREIDGAAVAWPLDETTTTQSYARAVHPADSEGRELVINGGFDSNTTWTGSPGVTSVADGVAHFTAAPATAIISQTSVLVTGKQYRTTYTVSNMVPGGNVRIVLGASGVGTLRTADGTYTEDIIANGTSINVSTPAGGTFDIDNVSVKQLDIPSSQTTTATNLITDGDMEAAGTTAWTVGNPATLTKETTSPYGGSQHLRIARSSSNAGQAYQAVLTIGNVYRASGYARSDGSAVPRVISAAGTHFTGTTSTSWQPFDFIFVATGTNLVLEDLTSTGTQYVEFDSVTVTTDTTIRTGELLQDGELETWTSATDLTNWTEVLSGTSTINREASTIHGGTYAIRLDIDASNSSARLQQNVVVIGKTYVVKFWARADVASGVTMSFSNASGSQYVANQPLTNVYEQYSYTFIASGDTGVGFTRGTGANSHSIYIDDISVTEVSPMVGLPAGSVTLGASSGAGGHGATAYSFDGSDDLVNVYSSDLNSTFNPDEGTVVAWAKVSAADVWTNGRYHEIFHLDQSSGQNSVSIQKTATDNTLTFSYAAGGTNSSVSTTTAGGNTGWLSVVMTWSTSQNQFKAYVNGAQVGTTQTGLGTWVGNFVNTAAVIGASSTYAGSPWLGQINDVRLYNRALTPEEISVQYSASSDIIPYTTSNYPGKELFRKYDTRVTTGTLANEEITPGPIGEWNFDEGQGQSVQDSTQNNNDGTLGATSGSSTDDPTWVTEDQCVSGKCLRFDGVNDVITLTSQKSFSDTDPWSVSFWANYTGGSSYKGMVLGDKDNSTDFIWLNQIDSIVRFRNSSNLVSDFTYPNFSGVHHYAMVANGSGGLSLFIDGKLIESKSNRQTSFSIDAIGNAYTGTTYIFQGTLDEVKIYPYARSAVQVAADYTSGAAALGGVNQAALSNGLVGYWKMDETSGTTVADASGNGNTGTLTNAQETGTADASGGSTTLLVDTDGTLSTTNDAYNGMILRVTSTCGAIAANTDRLISDYTGASKTFTVASAFAATLDSCPYQVIHQTSGKYGSGVAFDGYNASSDYITTSDLDLDYISAFTWIKPSSNQVGDGSGYNRIIGKKWSSSWALEFSGTSRILRWEGRLEPGTSNAPCYGTTGVTNMAANEWHHVGFTFDGATLRLFVNGKVDATCSQSGLLGKDNELVRIGSDAWTGGKYQGFIDETRIYNRALSVAEVADLYSLAPGPVAHWKMDEGSGTTSANSGSSGSVASVGSAIWSQGKYGNALTMDGDDTISVANYTPFQLKQFTVMSWIKSPSAPASGGDTTQWLSGGNNFIFSWNHLNSSFQQSVAFYSDANAWHKAQIQSTLQANTWYHITGTYDGSQLKIYLNGKLEQSTTTTAVPTLASSLSLGSNFPGTLDDVRIYNYARTPEQILQDMQADAPPDVTGNKLPEPLAHYSLDEQQGQTANNRGVGGSTLNGTLGASSTASTDDPTWKTKADCKVNGCASFDGSADFISLPDNSLDTLSTGAVCSWVYFDQASDLGNQGAILTYSDNAGVNYKHSLYISDSGTDAAMIRGVFRTNTSSNQTDYYTANNAIARQTWTHLCFNQDGNGVDLYINGAQKTWTTASVGTGAASDWFDDIASTAEEATIGNISDNAADTFFPGKLDEVKIYNTALSSDQIKQDMNAGQSLSFGTTAAAEASTLADGAGAPPVGYWTLDEKTGSRANDTSGNGNYGSLFNGIWSAGKVGAGVYLDGDADYITMGDPASGALDFSDTDNFTISFWMKPSNYSALQQTIIDKVGNCGTASASGYGVCFNGTTRKIEGHVSSGVSNNYFISSVSTIPNDVWTHITFVWDQDSATYTEIYINGKADLGTDAGAVQTTVGDLATAQALAFGRNSAASFKGVLDDVKIYNYARTPAQIAYDYNRGAPIAHWRMDECQGSTINDSSGNGNTGTLTVGGSGEDTIGTCSTASTAWGSGATGKYNSSLSFDGTDDYVDLGNNAVFSSSQISVSSWVKFNSLSLYKTIISKDISTNPYGGWTLRINGNAKLDFSIGNSSTNYLTEYATSNMSNGVWYNVLGTYDGETTKLYVNGVLVASNAAPSGALTTNSANVNIGRSEAFGRYFNGQIDDVRIYNYALSATQVQKLYNENFGVRFGPSSGSP